MAKPPAPIHAGRRRRQTGASGVVGAAVTLVSAAMGLVAFGTIVSGYLTVDHARSAADEALVISKATAAYVIANQQAFISATGGQCGGITTQDSSGNSWIAYNLNSLPLNPATQGSTGISCSNPTAAGFLPTAPSTWTNRYQQTYRLATRIQNNTGNPNANNAVQAVSAVIYTTGGAPLSNPQLADMTSRLGSVAEPIYNSGIGSPYGRSFMSNSLAEYQAGHISISLDRLSDPASDDNLHRYGTPGNSAPNQMNATLYMANASATEPTTPNNIDMNYAAAATGATAASGSSGSGLSAPHNSIYGARQVDTQTLTAGSSVANSASTNAQQAQQEAAAGETVNDTATSLTGSGQSYPDTILANSNLDVTAGHRMAAADGYHITATNISIVQDRAHSYAGAPSYFIPNTNEFSSTYQAGTSIVNGLTWDAVTGGGALSIGEWISQDPTNGSAQNQGAPFSPAHQMLAAYNFSNTMPVGFEATGGFRGPIYYDSSDMTYFVMPRQTSYMGNIILKGNGQIDPKTGQPLIGTLTTNGFENVPYPTDQVGKGIMTHDVFSNGGTIAAGCNPNEADGASCSTTSDGTSHMNAYIAANGDMFSTHQLNTGFLNALYIEVQGAHCMGEPVPWLGPSEAVWQHQSGGEQSSEVFTYGTISKDSSGKPLYCSADTGNWEYMGGQQFQQTTMMTFQTGQTYTNTYGTPMFVSSNCQATPLKNGFMSSITVSQYYPNGSYAGSSNSQLQEGGSDGNESNITHIAFMIPAGYSFTMNQIFGQKAVNTNTFCSASVSY